MQGANGYVKAGQGFQFGVAAAHGIWNAVSFTYDNSVRLRVAGGLQNVASDIAVEFDSPTTSRTGWVVLKIAGRSRIDRARGVDIRDDCLRAAQAAGLVVNNSQADIDIYPLNSNVRVAYNFQDVDGGGGNDPSGLPSLETMLLIGAGLIVAMRIFRG
jgi:hypothetical protein